MSGVDFARIMQTQENGIASHWPAQEDVGLFRHIFDMGPHLQGYAGRMDASFVDALRRLPEVDYVERDSIVDVTM
ncbi:protease inhibitor I9 family protein, partial [Klebsiella pneumoniae]|nr:protease inhibitor I9 family protein [Klebsiella pneumoniae]